MGYVVLNANCRPLLAVQECVTRTLALSACQFTQPEHPDVVKLQQNITMANNTVNSICRDNIHGMSFGFYLYRFYFPISCQCREKSWLRLCRLYSK